MQWHPEDLVNEVAAFDPELAGPGSSNRGDRFSASESRRTSTGGDHDLARAIGTTNATSRKVRA